MADHGTGTNNTGNTQTLSTAAASVFAAGGTQGSHTNPRSVAIQNIDSAINIFIGFGTDLTAANGWRLQPGETFTADLYKFDAIYAIAASGTPEIRWIALNG